MKKTTCLVVGLIACFCLAGLCGCGGDDDNDTATVSGTAYLSTAPDGVKVYMKLVASGADSTATALYFTASEPFSSGEATYTLTGVENGSYTGYAFIDMNENAAGDDTSMPDDGDYVTDGGGDLVVNGDTVSDIPEVAWVAYSD